MMITRKTRLLMLGLILLIVLLLLVWLFLALRSGKTQEPADVAPVETAQPVKELPADAPNLKNELLEQEQQSRNESAGVIAISKTFAERYGSYSNEARFQNLSDVLPLMTQTFADQTNTFILTANVPDEYYGVTTSVLTVKVEAMDESAGKATLLMQTQREISEGSTQNSSISYQEIRLELMRDGGVWKVDSASWL